jgi:U3 small nucleolar RNA-associated protein 12
MRLPDKTSVCAGYSSGEARIFNYIQGNLTTTFRGHRSAVTAIAVDEESGSLMATGGADCDIIIWDLVALNGIVRFHDHKDVVTGLAFLNRGKNQKLLLSVSKDTLLKVRERKTWTCDLLF